MIEQGEIWWADLDDPAGSGAGFRRPVLIMQGDRLNRSRISTAICFPLTSQTKWAKAPGNVMLKAGTVGLDRDSIVQVALVFAVDRWRLSERIGKVSASHLDRLFAGLDSILERRA